MATWPESVAERVSILQETGVRRDVRVATTAWDVLSSYVTLHGPEEDESAEDYHLRLCGELRALT